MRSLVQRLQSEQVLCADGAWATALFARGWPQERPPELANVERSGLVRDLAASYRDAGADLIGTNSFGANRLRLGEAGSAYPMHEINVEAVQLTRQGAGHGAFVWACVGPSGQDDFEVCVEHALALVQAGADALSFETMLSVDEAVAAIDETILETAIECTCTFTFVYGEDGVPVTLCGTPAGDAARRALDAGAVAVGANCCDGPDTVLVALRAMSAETGDAPLVARPNAGLPLPANGALQYSIEALPFAAYVSRYADAGARIIGGCCGTGPAHVAAIRAAIDRL